MNLWPTIVIYTITNYSNYCMSYSIVVGLNPALQKRFILSTNTPSLIPNNVHRASSIQVGVGGKGQDVVVALKFITNPQCAQKIYLMQFMGGDTSGDVAMSKLRAIQNDTNSIDVEALTIRCQAPLRICTTVVGKNEATELIEPSDEILASEIKSMDLTLHRLLYDTKKSVQGLCFMGSMPPGCPIDYYAQIFDNVIHAHMMSRTSNHSRSGDTLKCFIDSIHGLFPILERVMESKYHSECMLKINYGEFRKLANSPNLLDAEEASIHEIDDLIKSISSSHIVFHHAVRYLALTNGKHPAYFVNMNPDGKRQYFRLNVRDMDKEGKVIFPIGAGDAVSAGSFAKWCNHPLTEDLENFYRSVDHDSETCDALNAFHFGLACGSASCLQVENSVLDVNDVIRIMAQISVQKVDLDHSL